MDRPSPAPLDPAQMSPAQRERRERILDAVVLLLDQVPHDQLQVKEVARRSQVALGTLYRYFPTKEQLLAAAMMTWNWRLAEGFSGRRQALLVELSPYDRVLELFRAELRAYQRRPHLARLEVELHVSVDAFVIETVERRALANRTSFLELLPEVPPETARVAAVAIGGTFLNGLALWSTGRISFVQALRNVEDVVGLGLGRFDEAPAPDGGSAPDRRAALQEGA